MNKGEETEIRNKPDVTELDRVKGHKLELEAGKQTQLKKSYSV